MNPIRKEFHIASHSVAEPEPVGAGTIWSEPVWRSGSGSILDKTEEILIGIISVRSNIE